MEIHENPDKALSDGPNMIPLTKLEEVLQPVVDIHNSVRKATPVCL
jgi:2-dehydro-3-deoxyphosphooctonate aldolase (KDO 8-P synthase)